VSSVHAAQATRLPSGLARGSKDQHVGPVAIARLGGGEKLVGGGGGGAVLVVNGVSSGPCRSVLARTRLGVELERRQWAHSASCAVSMA
jgi:hypothetical protein